MNQLTTKQLTRVNKLIFSKSLVIGFCGGIIWSTLFVLLHVFNMIEINPMILFETIFGQKVWLAKWYTYIMLILVIGILSMIIAITYFFTLKKLKSWLVGGGYGVLIWTLLIVLLPLIMNGFTSISMYNIQTYVATLCVLLLYGTFIGYSISFEYQYAVLECRKR